MTNYHRTFRPVNGRVECVRVEFFTSNSRREGRRTTTGRTTTGTIIPAMVARSDRATTTGFDFGVMCGRLRAIARAGKATVTDHYYPA